VFYADNYNIYIALIVINEYLHYPYFVGAIKQRISISHIDWPYALKNTFTQKVRKFSYVDVIGNGDMSLNRN